MKTSRKVSRKAKIDYSRLFHNNFISQFLDNPPPTRPSSDKRKSSEESADIFKSPLAPPPAAKKRKSFDSRKKLLLTESNADNINEDRPASPVKENPEDSVLLNLSDSFYQQLDQLEGQNKNASTSKAPDFSDSESILNISAYLTQSIFASQPLTQATDCIRDAQDNRKNFKITHNAETSSQYVQSIKEGERDVAGTSRLLPVSYVRFQNIGPWFGLTNQHKNYLLKMKGIEDLYDWQKECLDLRAIHERKNLIYALPTSGGKTLVAEIAMFREVLLRKKNVMFILPFVSIVQEKLQDLASIAVEYNFLLEEYCAGKGSIPCQKRRKKNVIYICTIEKAAILFDSLLEGKRLNEIGLIVVDELHLLGDPQRGYILETMLQKTINSDISDIQIIGMSATISNLPEVAEFLRADIYTRDFRPVELTEYAKIGAEIYSINQKASCVSEAFVKLRDCGDKYNQKMEKRDPDHLLELVMEVCPKFSCLIFCATKANCESVAHLLCDLLSSELQMYKRDEKKNLIEAIRLDLNGRICPTLLKTIPFGIAYHHSGLMMEERRHIEEAYRLGIISVICCTSTLAAGVNLPAKRVIIRSPYVGNNFITLTTYKQMVGRAGRAGKCDSGESIIVCNPKDLEKLTDVLCSKMDETISGFMRDDSGKYLKSTILNLVALKVAKSIDELVSKLYGSLFNIQILKNNEKIRSYIVPLVEQLVEESVMTAKPATSGRRLIAFTTQQGVDVYPDDELSVSQIGKAAVNSGLTLKEAKIVEMELRKAQNHFTFKNNIHLFYIAVPSESLATLRINYHETSTIFTSLDETMTSAARILGITESLCGRMISRQNSIKESEQLIIKRFLVALVMYDMWNGKEVYHVSKKYNVDRGFVNGILSTASARSFAILKFCESDDEFWGFKALLQEFTKRLSHCCSVELLPLMELPGVKIVSCVQISF